MERQGRTDAGAVPSRGRDATWTERGEVTATAEDGKDGLKSKAAEAKHAVKEKAKDTTEDLKARGREEKERLEARAEEKVSQQKRVAAGKAHALANALREAGATLDRDGEGELARYGRQAAEQVERAAGYLERNDLHGFVHDLERTARDHPGAFVGGTFAAGLMLGRFLRSSRPEPETAGGVDGSGRPTRSMGEAGEGGVRSAIERMQEPARPTLGEV